MPSASAIIKRETARGAALPAYSIHDDQMSHLALRPWVHAALVDGEPVLLDARADRYFGLDPELHCAFTRAAAGQAVSGLELSELVATGLFEQSEKIRPFLTAGLPSPVAQLEASRKSGVSPFDVLRIWRLVHQADSGLRMGRLGALLAQRSSLERQSPLEPFQFAQQFLAARQFVPTMPSCLQDSIALLQWLRNHCSSASLVIGVKLNPFAAHCWVQSDLIVLNDAPDWVQTFTPIFVLP